MDKLSMETPNLTLENVEKIEKLFPNCVKEAEDDEGNKIKKVDFDLLRAELGDKTTVEGLDERYRLDWPGKKNSILKANTPITKTLRPVKEDSVDWDNTQNLYIEGDNFEVLKILQESYLGRVKCIYVDPPYNTGNDFVYNDDFAEDSEEYKEKTEQNVEGLKMIKNTENRGRYHSDWLSMMYERIKVARDLLSDDGVFFISIDDNELDNLNKICSEIFGEENFVGIFSVENNPKGRKNGKFISVSNEYCLIFSKNYDVAEFDKIIPKHANDMAQDENGDFVRKSGKRVLMGENTLNKKVTNFSSEKHYSAYILGDDIIFKKESEIDEIDNDLINKGYKRYYTYNEGAFVENTYTMSKFKELFENHALDIREDKIYEKHFSDMMQIKSMLVNNEYDAIDNNKLVHYKIDLKSTSAKQDLTNLMGGEYFSFPKNVSFIWHLLKLQTKSGDIIMDFFSGSATTAHACIQLNSDDGGNRKFIMVQLPELIEEESDAYKAGYKNICEIGKERIRRAGKKIKEETGADIDYGFRVYRVDESCMKDVYYHPSEAKQENLALFTSNIKEDRTPEDLLTQVILNFGLTLDLPIEEKFIGKNKVFYVAGNSLIACFDENIDDNVIDEIAKDEPIKLVFRDACFKNDAQRINVENKVKRVSPETIIKVI